MNLRKFQSVKDRRSAIEEHLHVSLPHMGNFSLDEHVASSRNCENMIGVTQTPVGVVGPLVIKHSSTTSEIQESREYYVPLATTEGALVASVNRGCKAITESGGAITFVNRVGISRGPVFKTTSLSESVKFQQWLQQHDAQLKESAESTSSHLHYVSSESQIVGNLVFVRFLFDSQDAMGMNMATIATQAIAEMITKEIGVRCLSISGNFCVDKKPSWKNMIDGRGFTVRSEVFVPASIRESVLKVSVDSLLETWQAKCLIGSAITGTLGFNGHAANMVAALYLATGQDIAHVVEGSSTVTTMEKRDDGIVVSVYMPSVIVGTVGGGTGLGSQKEALELLGVYGGNEGKNSETLAGIVGATVLAGELSELSALATGTLTQAHVHLGRSSK